MLEEGSFLNAGAVKRIVLWEIALDFLNHLYLSNAFETFFMRFYIVLLVVLSLLSCSKDKVAPDCPPVNEVILSEPTAFFGVTSILYNNLSFDAVIDKPALKEMDVLLIFHGTVAHDSSILNAAQQVMEQFQTILDREDMMIVSVAYPGEQELLGDNIQYAEAAFLWVKNQANMDLGITVKKIFIAGHSQGGYLATRLNTMYESNGVIANAPGPLDLVYRCELEENGQIPAGATCTKLKNVYGTTSSNPTAYYQRSLLNFTQGFKSDVLFVQGMDDSPIQMHTYPTFKQDVMSCITCQNSTFLEILGEGHGSLFISPLAKTTFNDFINTH